MYIGVDEAGRGPALGPLVVGLVVWDNPDLPDHVKLADSKELSPDVRRRTAAVLEERVRYRVLSIPAWWLDRASASLPQLEARVIRDGLTHLPGCPTVCDLLENGTTSHNWLRHHAPRRTFSFEPRAEQKYSGVAAASILAKVNRDRAMERLSERWGSLGSGYPSDPSTRCWLESWADRKRPWPPFVRTRWSTVQKLEDGST